MAVETKNGSKVLANRDVKPTAFVRTQLSHGRARGKADTVEVSAAADPNSKYILATLPSSARILPSSKLFGDDLHAGAGAPTLDIGVFNKPGRTDITDDPDALNDGIVATAVVSADVLKTPVDMVHKQLWELVTGLTADPKVELDIAVTILDNLVDTGGTLTLCLDYVED